MILELGFRMLLWCQWFPFLKSSRKFHHVPLAQQEVFGEYYQLTSWPSNSNLIQNSKGAALPDNVFLHIVPEALSKVLGTTQAVQEMGFFSKTNNFPWKFLFPGKTRIRLFLFFFLTSTIQQAQGNTENHCFKHLFDMPRIMTFSNDTP